MALKKHEFWEKLRLAIGGFGVTEDGKPYQTPITRQTMAMQSALRYGLRVHGHESDEVVNVIIELYGSRDPMHILTEFEKAWEYYENLEKYGSVHFQNDK